ncbi:MAG: glycoside hydrolase 43 family protein [Ferruginibacter sp.]|nr:glycoside hydrolase 43 family protein [Ferruginibacter sp.]
MKKALALLLLFIVNAAFAQQSDQWGDQGNGTYINPVLPGDYSDIDAIRVGNDYYAISSTFQYSPGMVILHSKDLVSWKILGHVANDLTRISPALNWDQMDRYGKGIWAGAIRFHKNKFWVYFCTPGEGFFMSTASNPAGPWEPLHKMWGVSGWDDCCPFWDDDGQGYLVTTNFADQYKIHLFKMNADGKQIIMESDSVIHQSKGSEASKLYKINGTYYHFYSEVKSEGRVPMMHRSKNIYGPYETKQLFHVNKQKDKEPNQGGLIQRPSGDWWFFTHQGTGSWEGRTACLLPVTWINGWPIIGAVGADTIGNMIWEHKKPEPKSTAVFPQTNDEFNNAVLPVQWEWNYQPRKENWSLTQRAGFLRLHAFVPVKLKDEKDKRSLLYRAGNTITQRCMRTKKNEVTIKMDITKMADRQLAGLCHYAATYSTFGIKQLAGVRRLVYDNNGKETAGPIITGNAIWLRSAWGFDGISHYAYSLDGKIFTPLGGEYKLTWGYYRGDRIGIYSFNEQEEKGWIDVDWFHYNYATF